MAKSPDRAETITPAATGPTDAISIPPAKASGASTMTEPIMDGIDMRNANFTANSLLSPDTRPPKSVEPDLEIPGHMATPCISPTEKRVSEFHFLY